MFLSFTAGNNCLSVWIKNCLLTFSESTTRNFQSNDKKSERKRQREKKKLFMQTTPYRQLYPYPRNNNITIGYTNLIAFKPKVLHICNWYSITIAFMDFCSAFFVLFLFSFTSDYLHPFSRERRIIIKKGNSQRDRTMYGADSKMAVYFSFFSFFSLSSEHFCSFIILSRISLSGPLASHFSRSIK